MTTIPKYNDRVLISLYGGQDAWPCQKVYSTDYGVKLQCPKITLCKCSFLSVCCVVFLLLQLYPWRMYILQWLANSVCCEHGQTHSTWKFAVCLTWFLEPSARNSEMFLYLHKVVQSLWYIVRERERETVSEHGLIKQHTRSPYEMRERKRHRARKRSGDWQGRWS